MEGEGAGCRGKSCALHTKKVSFRLNCTRYFYADVAPMVCRFSPLPDCVRAQGGGNHPSTLGHEDSTAADNSHLEHPGQGTHELTCRVGDLATRTGVTVAEAGTAAGRPIEHLGKSMDSTMNWQLNSAGGYRLGDTVG